MSLQNVLDDLRGASFKDVPERQRAEAAKRFVERCGYASAALTLLPVPFSDVFAVVPLHVGMVAGIGEIYGREITRDSATELCLKIGTAAGLSLVGRRLVTAATKVLLPGLGGLLAAPAMYAQTIALGTVVRAWFERDGALSDVEIKVLFGKAAEEAKESYTPSRADPIARIEKLRELKEKGFIDQAEFDEQKKRILAEV